MASAYCRWDGRADAGSVSFVEVVLETELEIAERRKYGKDSKTGGLNNR
jgi:hypothetical protein